MDAEKNEIGRKSLRGGIVNLGSQGITIIIQFASIIILSRLLTPSAFGTVAMVTVITAFASIFKDMGLSAATIQREDINHDQVSALFWLNVLMGCAVAAFLILFSPIIASFYNRPELVWVTVVLSLNILISCIGTQHSALLARQMKFKKIAYCRLSGVITTFCISVITAYSGLGYWALVAGVVSGTFIQVVMLWIVNPWIPGRARSNAGVKEMMKYGLNLTGFDFVNYFSRNLDNLLIGKIWGADALGLYTRAYSLMLFPINNIRGPLSAVALPAMSRLQGDTERFRAYYRRLVALLGIVTMPIAAICFSCSEQIIFFLLGEKWAETSKIVRWLAVASFLQPVSGIFGIILMAKGLANRHLRCGIVTSIIISVTFLVSVFWGPEKLAISYAVAQYALFLPIFLYASKGTEISLHDFFISVWRPAICCVVSTPLAYSIGQGALSFERLIGAISVFCGMYTFSYCLLPGGISELRYYFKRIQNSLM